MRQIIVVLAGLLLFNNIAFAQVTETTDCNARCPSRWIKVGGFKTKYRDPTCKLPCESAKPVAGILGVPIPVPRGIIEDTQRNLERSCALGFETITKALISYTPPGQTAADAGLINQAKQDLIGATILQPADFGNVSISFHKLLGNGVAPDRNIVYLNETFRKQPRFEIATLLAHEMKHIEQYRRLGTDSFKCNYTKHFIKCGGCQDVKHEMELEAEKFEDQARFLLTAYYQQQPEPFIGEANPALTGTYGVISGGCTPRLGPARIYQRVDGILIASNECRGETMLEVRGDNQIVALQWENGLVGDIRGSSIYWRNNTQWFRATATPPLVGSWEVEKGGCTPRIGPARISVRNDGMVMATNECGSATELVIQSDGTITAQRWNNLVGDVTNRGSYIAWRNSTNWRWLRY